jgi:hypothetical protein
MTTGERKGQTVAEAMDKLESEKAINSNAPGYPRIAGLSYPRNPSVA